MFSNFLRQHFFDLVKYRFRKDVVAFKTIMDMLIKQFIAGCVVGTVCFHRLDGIDKINTFRFPAFGNRLDDLIDRSIGPKPQCVIFPSLDVSVLGLWVLPEAPVTSPKAKLQVRKRIVDLPRRQVAGNSPLKFPRGFMGDAFLVMFLPCLFLRVRQAVSMQRGKGGVVL